MSAFLALSTVTINQPAVLELDAEIAQAFYSARYPAVIGVFEVLTLLGREAVWLLATCSVVYLVVHSRWHSLVAGVLAFGIGVLLNQALKEWFSRPRPAFDDWVPPQAGYGFPSGHAMLAMIGWGMFTYLVFGRQPNRRLLQAAGVAALLVILIVGLSRLVLSAHFLSDVLGGWAAGAIWLLTCIAIHETLVRCAASRRPITRLQ